MKYVCELCGTVYDENMGDVKRGIPAGTAFADVPSYYDCPVCGSEKEAFTKTVPSGRIVATNPNDLTEWKHIKYHEDHHASER